MPPFNQVAYRFRNDDGNETTATWRQNQNTVDTVATDVNVRVRFEIQNGASVGNNKTWRLQYNLNGTGWVNVSNASLVVRSTPSPNLADAANLTNQLTAGTGTFQGATGFDEGNGQAGGNSMDVAVNGHAEAEYSIQVRGVDVQNGDTIGLRVTDAGTALPTYAVDATLTVVKSATGDLSTTENTQDIAALTGSVLVEGDLATTEEGDVAAANGSLVRNIAKITQLNAALYPSRRYSSFFHTQATIGNIAATDTADAVAAEWPGVVEWLTSFALLEAPDVAAFSGSVIVQGDLATTDTTDTIVATGFVGSGADLVATEAADILAATGAVSASAKKTQLNAALWPSRRYGDFFHPLEIGTGTMAATEAADVAAATGTVALLGNLAAIESSDSFSATSITRGKFTQLNAALWPSKRYSSFYLKSNEGLLAATESRDTAAFIGVIPTVIIGNLAATDPQTFIGFVDENDNHILDSSGNWIGAYYCADTAAADGTVGALEVIFGDLALIETLNVAVSSGGIVGTGTMAATEAADSPLFTGVLGARLGDLAATEPFDAFVSTATIEWLATFVATDPTDQASATATVEWTNNILAATEAPDVLAADGGVLVEGYVDAEEDEDIVLADGRVGTDAYLFAFESPDAFVSSGVIEWLVALAVTEPSDQASSAGFVEWLAVMAAIEASDHFGATGYDIIGTMAATESTGTGTGRLSILTVIS